MIKIAFFDTKSYDIPAFTQYGQERGVEFKFLEARLTSDTANLAKGYDGVCAFVNDRIDEATIKILHGEGIRMLALRCAGFNNVDVKAAFGKIHVYRVPAYSPYAVAEHAMALLQTSNRRIHKAYNRTRDYNFSLTELVGVDLHEKTIGVVGTGKIGKAFIDICLGFGMKVLAFDKFENPALKDKVTYTDLETVFKESDFISLHCPLTEDNFHLIDANMIAKMKKGVGIINTSRGGLIDGKALLEGIKNRQVGFACLDVYEEEGDIFYEDKSGHILDDDTLRSLLAMPNVIITSHQAFLTKEALNNIAETSVDNIVSFFEGRSNENEVCYHCPSVNNCRKKRNLKCF